MRVFLGIGAIVAVAACGGGAPSVSGAISEACIDGGRSAASPALCSCIQQVANQSLSSRDQSRAAIFFAEPQLAQDTRQSDRISDEAFWQRYKSFTELSTQICQPIDA
ncbi:arginine transporter [Yoonia sp. BS5-3]|uniref:Arginine transporter n=1 Tax=Yoonia phaeophyticola TaxID=3137369 RepID=A0ABZ2VBK4_9RHOB